MTMPIPILLAHLRENLRVMTELVTELERVLVGIQPPTNGRRRKRERAALDELFVEPGPEDVFEEPVSKNVPHVSPYIMERRRKQAVYRSKRPGFYTKEAREKRQADRRKILDPLPRTFTSADLERVLRPTDALARSRWVAQSIRAGVLAVVKKGLYRKLP